MAYLKARRFCKVCGSTTAHWQDRRQLGSTERLGLASLFRLDFLLGEALVRWRCVECDNPWRTSLLAQTFGHLRGASHGDRVMPVLPPGGSGWSVRRAP